MTSNITIRPFKLSDIWLVTPDCPDKMLIGHPDLMAGLYINACMNTAVTVVIDGRVEGCAGISIKAFNTAEIWAVYSSVARKFKKTMLRETLNFLDEMIVKYQLRRIEATARVDWPSFSNFLRHLGFSKEGLKRKFELDGTDAFMFARVIKWH